MVLGGSESSVSESSSLLALASFSALTGIDLFTKAVLNPGVEESSSGLEGEGFWPSEYASKASSSNIFLAASSFLESS